MLLIECCLEEFRVLLFVFLILRFVCELIVLDFGSMM